MNLAEFVRLEVDGKTVYRIFLSGDPDESEDVLESLRPDDDVVAQITITIDAVAFCQAVEAYKAVRALFNAVSLNVQADAQKLKIYNYLTHINLYWDQAYEELHSEFETVDQRSGTQYWQEITDCFPVPLTQMPAWEDMFLKGETHGTA